MKEITGSPVVRLAALADQCGLWAVDIVRLAIEYYTQLNTGDEYDERPYEQWVEMLESISIDVLELESAELLRLALDADSYNQREFRKLRESLEPARPSVMLEQRVTRPEVAPKESTAKPKKRRDKLFGMPCSLLIQWLGCEGWTAKQIRKLFDKCQIEVSDSTIRTQLYVAKQEDFVLDVELSDMQIDFLYSKIDA